MNGDIVAQRYAKALFALGQQEGMAKLECNRDADKHDDRQC